MTGVIVHMAVTTTQRCAWCGETGGCDCAVNFTRAFAWERADIDDLLDSLNAPGTDGEAAVLQHAPYPADAPTDTPRHTPQPR